MSFGWMRRNEKRWQRERMVAGTLCSSVVAMLELDVPDEMLMERLINRGKTSGRADDNEETIRKRLNGTQLLPGRPASIRGGSGAARRFPRGG